MNVSSSASNQNVIGNEKLYRPLADQAVYFYYRLRYRPHTDHMPTTPFRCYVTDHLTDHMPTTPFRCYVTDHLTDHTPTTPFRCYVTDDITTSSLPCACRQRILGNILALCTSSLLVITGRSRTTSELTPSVSKSLSSGLWACSQAPSCSAPSLISSALCGARAVECAAAASCMTYGSCP